MILGALALLALKPWSDRPIGRLPSAGIVGFARLPGLGRCLLTDGGDACYYKAGKILHRPGETAGIHGAQFGDIDGDGVDECVQVENGQIVDSVWRNGAFVPLDHTRLPQDHRRYEDPVLIPKVGGRAYLLLFVAPDKDGDWPYIATVAYRKFQDRWVKAWEGPPLPESNFDGPRWSLTSGSRVLVEATGEEIGDHFDEALLDIGKGGYRMLWSHRQKFVAERSPLVCFCEQGTADTDFLAVGTVFIHPAAQSPKKALFDGARKNLSPIAALPSDAKAVWDPQPGVHLLVVGSQIYRLNIPSESK